MRCLIIFLFLASNAYAEDWCCVDTLGKNLCNQVYSADTICPEGFNLNNVPCSQISYCPQYIKNNNDGKEDVVCYYQLDDGCLSYTYGSLNDTDRMKLVAEGYYDGYSVGTCEELIKKMICYSDDKNKISEIWDMTGGDGFLNEKKKEEHLIYFSIITVILFASYLYIKSISYVHSIGDIETIIYKKDLELIRK